MILIISGFESRHYLRVGRPLALLPKFLFYMSALFLLVAASLTVALFFLAAFLWSVRNRQFDDKQGSSMRMLYEDELLNKTENLK